MLNFLFLGNKYLNQRKHVLKLHTGSPELDQMIGGGIER